MAGRGGAGLLLLGFTDAPSSFSLDRVSLSNEWGSAPLLESRNTTLPSRNQSRSL